MKHSIFAFLLVIGALASCSSPKGAHSISGTISDAGSMNLYFDKIAASGNAKPIINTSSDANGGYSFNFEEKLDPGIYRLRAGAKHAFLMIQPEDGAVKVDGTLASLSDNTYTVSGSAGSAELQNALSQIGNARTNGVNLDKFVVSNQNGILNLFLANKVFNSSAAKLNVYKQIAGQLKSQYPESEYTKDIAFTISTMEATVQKQQSRGGSKFKVGDPAPEIVGLSPTGKEVKLSDLKGKVVLIDFWASWCRPCRKANPHVVEVYDKYKSQGFDVYSFSLDGVRQRQLAAYKGDAEKIAAAKEQQRKRWVDAIKQDNLKWASHASELASWGSKANREYGVSSIPTTFLVDREGNFAAINPRNNLEEAVIAALKS